MAPVPEPAFRIAATFSEIARFRPALVEAVAWPFVEEVWRCASSERSVQALPLVDRHVRNIAGTDVFRRWANQFVVRILLENMSGPATNTTNGKDWCVEVERNSHHVVSRSRISIDIRQ